ncbi:hypothetical protein R6Q57_000320 [Mikania cordata]
MKEALVVCGDKNLTVGLTIWDIETGDHLLHIPTCASPFHGITCLRNQYLVASQIQRPGSVAGGVIFTWPFSKVWDAVSGTLLQTWFFPQPITATVLDPAERFLFSGSADGRIFMSPFDVGLMKESNVDSDQLKVELTGHKESITALTFCRSGLISASEDCTACLWDIVEGVIIKRFQHHKGFITNMIVIPKSSLMERTPEALQLKVETNIESRLWINGMTKRMMEINDHLRSRLLDLNQHRIALEEKQTKKK